LPRKVRQKRAMSTISRIAQRLDRLGFRRPLALTASIFYPGRKFRVDREGRWINRQSAATFVSPTLHTTRFEDVEAWVAENWGWDYRPRPGDIVIDVGAGIGEETIVFAKWVGATGRVISIEAHPATFASLESAVTASGLTNVTLVQCALADEDGEISIESGEHHVASSVMSGAGVKVPARSLDSLLSQLGIDRVDFIKMNIEGAEKLALSGMKDWLGRFKAACISCHDFIADLGGSDWFRSKEVVRAALEEAGYALSTRPGHKDCWVRDYLYARLIKDIENDNG
jgi:FkbM family methyltransferase